MDSSGMAASDGPSTGVKRGLDQSSASGGDEAPSLPPEKKPAIAELVAQAAAAAAAAAAARVTSSAQQQGVILQPQGSQSPAQQGPLARPPMPTTPPVRLDITPGGENSASKFYGAIIASSLPEEFVREVKCPHSVMGRIIGPRGATINQLQSTTLCKIQCQPGQPGGFARVKISGPTQTCVDGAVTYVQAMVGNWDDYTDEQLMQAGGKETRKEIPLPYIHVGSVIGPKGSVIKTIEADTGAKLQVDNRSSRGSKEDRIMTISGPEHAVEKAAEYVMSVIAGTYDINQAVVRMTALDNSSGAYFNAQAQQFGNMQQQQAWAASQYSHWPNEQAIAQAAYQQAMADMAAGKIRQAAPPAAAAGGGTTSAGSTTVAAPVMDPATLKQWKDYIGQCDRAIADAPQEKRKEMKDYVDNLKRQYGLTDALLRDDGDEAEAKEQAAVDRRLAGVDKSTPAAVTAEKPTE